MFFNPRFILLGEDNAVAHSLGFKTMLMLPISGSVFCWVFEG